MDGTPDHHLMHPDPVHPSEEPFLLLPFETPIGSKGGVLVGYHSDPPSRAVGQTSLAISERLVGRHAFISRTKGTILFKGRFINLRSRVLKAVRPFCTLRCNDHPFLRRWILSQLRHRIAPEKISDLRLKIADWKSQI
jgi:hypothetical protein